MEQPFHLGVRFEKPLVVAPVLSIQRPARIEEARARIRRRLRFFAEDAEQVGPGDLLGGVVNPSWALV